MAFINGILFSLGFFLPFVLLAVVLLVKKNRSGETDGTQQDHIKAYQAYARDLLQDEKYEELQQVKLILTSLHNEVIPPSNLTKPYTIRRTRKLLTTEKDNTQVMQFQTTCWVERKQAKEAEKTAPPEA